MLYLSFNSAFYPSYISVVTLLQSLHFGGALNHKRRKYFWIVVVVEGVVEISIIGIVAGKGVEPGLPILTSSRVFLVAVLARLLLTLSLRLAPSDLSFRISVGTSPSARLDHVLQSFCCVVYMGTKHHSQETHHASRNTRKPADPSVILYHTANGLTDQSFQT